MKKKIWLIIIGLITVLAACSEEQVMKDKEFQSDGDNIDSIYTDGDVSISISISQERYKQGETPVVIIRNDGKTSVDYTGSGTILEYLQDNVWSAVDSDAVELDELNVLEAGKKIEQNFSPSTLLQKGVYRITFQFNTIKNDERISKRIAVSFYVDSP